MSNPEEKNSFSKSWIVFWSLTRRHLKVFFKNYLTVIFTLMVPICIFLVYILFLRNMETSAINDALKAEGIILDTSVTSDKDFLHHVYGVADCWIISGTLALSCITVSLNTNYIVVRDKESGINRDFLSSPIDPRVLAASYFVFNVIVTFLINFVVYLICLIYLLCYGFYPLPAGDFFAIIGVLILSVISASLFTFFILSFVKTESVMSPLIAIFSAAGGFLIGAYLPASMMPESINRLTTFFPGTYSAALLRNFFLRHPLDMLTNDPHVLGHEEFITSLRSEFSLDIKFFDLNVPVPAMFLVIVIFIAIFAILNLIFASRNVVHVGSLTNKKKKAKTNETEKN